jgi:hypothetical protein
MIVSRANGAAFATLPSQQDKVLIKMKIGN